MGIMIAREKALNWYNSLGRVIREDLSTDNIYCKEEQLKMIKIAKKHYLLCAFFAIFGINSL